MSARSLLVSGLGLVVVALASGCVNVNTRIPDVQIGSGGASATSGERRTPYAKELERVLKQPTEVEKELAKRKWEGVEEKLADWTESVRRLNSKSNTSHDPRRMRDYCGQLLRVIDNARAAAQRQDVNGVRRGLDQAGPWLNRLSAEFPTVEGEVPPAGGGSEPPARSRAGEAP